MTQQEQVTQDQVRPEISRGHYLLEVLGILCFMLLLLLIGVDVYQGMLEFGDLWLAPILTVLAYLAADFLSGFVHFLADNFGSYDTPIIGPNFIEPFREHHIDPKGIVGNDFVDANGNNSLASLPFMLGVWVLVPLETTYYGYLFGIFSLFLCLAAFLTNQFHKWAHMDDPPAFVRWLQALGCDPLQRAPRHPSREPLRHLLLHHRGVLEPHAGPHPFLRAGGASDPALRPRRRPQAQVREGRDPRRMKAAACYL